VRSLSKRPANKLAARLRQRLDNARRLDSVMRADLATLRDAHTRLQARFDLLRESTSDGLWDVELGERKLMDPANEFLWSEQVRRMVGYGDASELPNGLSSLLKLLHPDDVLPTVTAFTAHIHDRSGQTPYDVTYRLRCKSGEYRWFRALSHAQRNAAGHAIRVAGALTDITDRRTMGALKRYAEAIVASLPTGLMVLDGELYIQSMNRAFCDIVGLADEAQMRGQDFGAVIPKSSIRELAASLLAEGETRHGIGVDLGDKHLRVAMAAIVLAEGERRLYGWSSDEVLGHRIDHWLYRDGPAASGAVVKITLDAGEWSGEIAQRRKDGALLTVDGYWTLVRDEDERPQAFLVINTDITQRKASDEKIRNLALYDALTGLANRSLLTERMTGALERAGHTDDPLAVLFLDLNRFKEINDTQGHGVGDQVLVKVARRFQAALREEEVLARLAGDEFVVVAERADAAVAARIAQRLVDAMQDPVATHGQTFPVGLSIGIATFPHDGLCMDDLLKRADIAMYRAKAAGGGFMFYQPEMSVGLLERIELAKDLSSALAEGTLELHFQPQVDLASGRAIGAEALLRWHDPRRGWVSPGVFIPIAESRGMICALGRWVLGEACRQMRAWVDAGLRFPGRLWINLAAQQLEEADLVASIRGITHAAGIAPGCLALELTESGLMADVEGSIRTMATLREDGFAIAIDDFGTGYSSLAYLKRLPADKLKIDMSFVRDMLTDRHDYTIVTTIIGMARNLGLDVIAEGVEEGAQAQALRSLGCGEAQGYYFGRPVPAEVFAEKWLSAV